MASGGVLGCRWGRGDEWSRGGRDNGETGYGQSLNKQARERERRQADAAVGLRSVTSCLLSFLFVKAFVG